MSRVINTENAGKTRNRLSKAVVKAIRELASVQEPDQTSRDQAAFIALALQEIYETVEETVVAWEKRDYWVKADRFRLEWEWSKFLGEKMQKAVLANDWGQIGLCAMEIAQKFPKIKIAPRNRIGEPWHGAWEQLKKVV